jgi:FKBP-type peptidyl-prolyl cis-trans isomerase SlyD
MRLMNVAANSVVSIHYTLKNDAGDVLDRSESGSPLAYLHGRGNLIPGLERELEGKQSGDKLQVTVPPAQAYGEYDKSLIQRVPRSAVRGVDDLQAGMQLHARAEGGIRTVTVTEVDDDSVTLDGNHPLAGQTLHFDVEIAEIRQATEEELAHGHVHGPGGHHHH